MSEIGITGYGSYIPRFRVTVEEIARVWREDGKAISKGINVIEKAVPGLDEDTITLSVESARNAIDRAGINPSDIGAVYVGSESHPYVVKPSAVTVAEAVGAVPHVTAADLEFACKAGTAGMQMIIGMVAAQQIECGLAIGSDCAQGRPGDALEYTAGSGSATFVIGKDNPIATVEGTYSFTTDTPDFFRREGQSFPMHGSRFTGKPAYFKHTTSAAYGLMERLGIKDNDIDYAVFHTPNGKFPIAAARMLRIPLEKVMPSLVVRYIGNTYSASSMLGLCAVLDIAEPGQRILMISYGSGAGSDAFSFVTTDRLVEVRDLAPLVTDYVNYKQNINYAEYAKHRGKIVSLEM
ncbi:MAG: hydroxymethylglutaryl-CoA synthase [Candidatus Hodarchaeales archaeon]|jgi:hydroxymethylglutaryl-CoA synthase